MLNLNYQYWHMIRCIAIDDEPLALRQIKSYIEKCPELVLLGTFSSSTMAQRFIAENSVDLIFVDINMPDLNGVDLVKSLKKQPMTVFTTAYSEYAIEGFRLDAIDYLLKPFSQEDFQKAVHKAVSLQELKEAARNAEDPGNANDVIAEAMPEPDDRSVISIKADHKTTLVRTSSIVMIESEGEYVRLNLDNKVKIVTLFRLKNMEDMLPESDFLRIHRSYIVNLNHVAGYTKGRAFLDNGEYIPIGENYKKMFQDRIQERTKGNQQ